MLLKTSTEEERKQILLDTHAAMDKHMDAILNFDPETMVQDVVYEALDGIRATRS